MKILEVKPLEIPAIKVIKFARFEDERGYFTETFRKRDMINHPDLGSMKNVEFVQENQAYSKEKTIRGLHFQWKPRMGKLVRIVSGEMVDLALDLRKGSLTYGKIVGYEMIASQKNKYDECIWIPPGFAHGFCFPKNTLVEYLCTGEYNPECESGISPLAKDIGWEFCDKNVKKIFDDIVKANPLISEKDKNGLDVLSWKRDIRSNNFIYNFLK